MRVGPRDTIPVRTNRTDDTGNAGTELPAAPAQNTGWTPRNTSGGWGAARVAAADDGFATGGPQRLQASVGPGTANRPADVRLVQSRLRELGFPVGRDGVMDVKTAKSLRLFEAIVAGTERATDVKGKLAPGSDLETRFFGEGAPKWVAIPSGGTGWTNVDTDRHGHGTDRLVSVINKAGEAYDTDYIAGDATKPLIMVNDASLAAGGDTRDHESHETGLDLDIRLPSTDGKRTTTKARNFDQAATIAVIKSFAEQPEVERVLVHGTKLLEEIGKIEEPWARKVLDGGLKHNNHVHVDVSAP